MPGLPEYCGDFEGAGRKENKGGKPSDLQSALPSKTLVKLSN
jgi:hypothetical protein